MAIYKAGALVDEVRGTLGGNIFSRNKGGRYVRAWSRGSNPRTQLQTQHRAKLVGFAQAWKGLTTTQKGNWGTYAALPAQEFTNSLGDPYYISGFNWYIRINLNLQSAGEPSTVLVPTLGIPAIPIVDSLRVYKTGGSTNSRFILSASDPDYDNFHILKCELYNSVGRLVASQIRKFCVNKTPTTPPYYTKFQTEIDDLFGVLLEGQRVFFSLATQYTDGRRGAVWSSYDNVRP